MLPLFLATLGWRRKTLPHLTVAASVILTCQSGAKHIRLSPRTLSNQGEDQGYVITLWLTPLRFSLSLGRIPLFYTTFALPKASNAEKSLVLSGGAAVHNHVCQHFWTDVLHICVSV
jgi:hypothetical protein